MAVEREADALAPAASGAPNVSAREPPRRRVMVELRLGADSWDEVAAALEQIAREVSIGQMRAHVSSGSPTSSYAWLASEDERVTHDSYFEALDAYLEEERAKR